VATWNLDAKGSPGAAALLSTLDADVLLLTEVPVGLDLPGYDVSPSGTHLMGQGQHYAAVATRRSLAATTVQLPSRSSSAISAAVLIGGTTYVSSVLPWGFAPDPPYRGVTQAEQTVHAVDELQPFLAAQDDLVWGGDWNHPLSGSLRGFTRIGHDRIAAALTTLDLTAHTALELTAEGCGSIDHVASRHPRQPVTRLSGRPFSPHDAYVVELGRELPAELSGAADRPVRGTRSSSS
jgi:hypothetical protein